MQNSASYVDNPKVGIELFYQKLISINLEDRSFIMLAMPYVVIATITNWFTRVYGLRWREAITFDYVPKWRSVTEDIEGASQRIQEDTHKFAQIVENLGLKIVRSIMTLIAFIPVLWELSAKTDIPFMGMNEGSLVFFAFVVSIGGLLITWFVGAKLPGLEYNNQKVEAAFRKDLVLGEDDKETYAQPETILELFTGIKFNYQRLFNHYGYVDIWINAYDQFMVIVPYLLVGPGLFTKLITLGVVVQVSNAFSKVHEGFGVFLYQFTTITELRSIWKRLREFEDNLTKYHRFTVKSQAL
jgi:peptide/bleomycin uptake transporter|tara:strand:- start:174 stop:1070 length:897 start_codon:yes stop_codon:yes gene_type:complete